MIYVGIASRPWIIPATTARRRYRAKQLKRTPERGTRQRNTRGRSSIITQKMVGRISYFATALSTTQIYILLIHYAKYGSPWSEQLLNKLRQAVGKKIYDEDYEHFWIGACWSKTYRPKDKDILYFSIRLSQGTDLLATSTRSFGWRRSRRCLSQATPRFNLMRMYHCLSWGRF